MSKYYEELLKLVEKDEEKVRKLLMHNYITSLVDMKKKLKEYMMINDGLTYAQQLEMKRLDSLIEQININLKKLYDSNYDTITKYDRETFEREYFGVFYEVENLANINLSFSMLNEKYVEEAIEFPIEGLKLSERLYDKHLMDMKYRVKGAVTQGLINSSGYAAIAKTISDIGFANFNHAMTIAVTEAGRMKSLARQKGQEEAVSKGVDLQKKWLSTLDKKTRHSHQKLDGQTVPIDGEFEINGHKAPQPRLFGIAKEDIRCRCDTITIVEGIDPSLRRDNETGEVTNFKNYTEWKQDKINKIGKEKYEIEEKKVKNTSRDKKQFKKYKEFLGDKAPKTLEDFQELKYNNVKDWELFKEYLKYLQENPESNEKHFLINKKMQELRNAGLIKIKGTVVKPLPQIIKELNDHTLLRMEERGITIEDAQSFIDNSLIAFKQRLGTQHAFYSEKGFTAISIEGIVGSTGWLDENAQIIIEEAKKIL